MNQKLLSDTVKMNAKKSLLIYYLYIIHILFCVFVIYWIRWMPRICYCFIIQTKCWKEKSLDL